MYRTGDIENALSNLKSALRKIHYDGGLDEQRARDGHPEFFLPLIHYAVLGYSRALAKFIAKQGHDLYGKSDLKFMEAVYKVLRDEFKYSPKLNKAQFFSTTFAEQKMLLTRDIITHCHAKHVELAKHAKRNRSKGSADARHIIRPPELGPSHADFGPVQSESSWHGSPSRNKHNTSRRPVDAAPSPGLHCGAVVQGAGPSVPHLDSRRTTGPLSATSAPQPAVPDRFLDVTDDAPEPQQLPTQTYQDERPEHSLHELGKSANEIPIETFFVPDDPSWQESYGANGELDVPLGWATQSLSAYSGEDGPYEVIRAPEKLSNAHGGDDGPAADTAPKTTPSMALYDGVGRLAHCVEGLSSRLERIEHEALSTRGGRHEAYRQGHVHDRDSELDFLRDTVTDLERRLVTVQSSFQDTMQSMTTQLMLFQQRLAAVETTQMKWAGMQPTSLLTAPATTLPKVTVNETENDQIRSVYASLERLEQTLGHESLNTSVRTPPRPGERSFRPPSTSSPRRPQSKLRNDYQ